MATDLCEGVFDQILLKATENDHFVKVFQRCPSSCILRTIGLSTDVLLIKLGLEIIWLVLVHCKQSYA